MSPHIGWRCRVIYRAVTAIINEDAQTHGVLHVSDDEATRSYRLAIHTLRRDMRSELAQSCVDAVGIVAIVATDLRRNKISGITACRDAAMAYVNYSLQGMV